MKEKIEILCEICQSTYTFKFTLVLTLDKVKQKYITQINTILLISRVIPSIVINDLSLLLKVFCVFFFTPTSKRKQLSHNAPGSSRSHDKQTLKFKSSQTQLAPSVMLSVMFMKLRLLALIFFVTKDVQPTYAGQYYLLLYNQCFQVIF